MLDIYIYAIYINIYKNRFIYIFTGFNPNKVGLPVRIRVYLQPREIALPGGCPILQPDVSFLLLTLQIHPGMVSHPHGWDLKLWEMALGKSINV